MGPLLRVWARRLIPIALAGLAVALVAINLHYVELAPARTSFVARWEGGHAYVAESLSPYDPEVSLRAQERVYGRPANLRRGEDPQHFLVPFPALVLFGPLGLLDFRVSHALWLSLLEISLFAATLGWIGALGWKPSPWMRACLLLFGAAWFPAFATLVEGQSSAIVWLLLVGALAATQARREALAGWLLALTVVKPQLGIGLLLFAVLWAGASGHRTLLGWLIVGLATLLGVSFLIEPDWPLGMARQVFDYLDTPAAPSALARLSGEVGAGSLGTLLMTSLALGYLLWEWRQSLGGDRRRFLWTAAMTQTVVLLVTPFSSVPNLVTLCLPITAILEAWYSRQGRAVDAPATVILGLIAAGSWILSLPTLEGGQASLWVLAGMPLAALFGLLWIRWWSIRGRVWSDLGSQGV